MSILRFDRAGRVLIAEKRGGDGPPLVVLPGVMADATSWRPVVEALPLPNPVIVINRRGRAPSGPLGDGYSVRTEIDDLHHVLDALGGAVDLFGWSYGALIALDAATERQDLRSVVAYEPVSGPFGTDALKPLRAAEGDLDRAVEIVNRVVSGFSAEYVAALRESPVWPVLRPLAHPLATELAAINDHTPAFDRYRDLDIPVTLLLGEVNEGVEPYGTAFGRFERALPQARRTVLPGQGHLAHAQAPEVLAEFLAAALRR
ncbi:alpha/beta fold hydrolase [Amycolatopsis granulosa]|uniref:alpha/beta fold hydrolase n=1 Tax=Amycolatopsis granulosa TaxID=185684 RepID=UPI001423A27B|nr:alpha/beta hydrolase [Amycolatopsis granulosa]NIH88201.1 pimeloyl-ACP methyl ester carboxylesterase [Amycolatopsis granulosa]